MAEIKTRRRIRFTVSEPEHAAIVAGLRALQNLMLGGHITPSTQQAIFDIASDCGRVTALTIPQVGKLCEQINHG